MVDKIKMIKDNVLRRMEQELSERGLDRIDVKEFGEMADVVKDLAEAEKSCWEAEYYRDITEAMDKQGYTPEGIRQGYSTGGMQGGRRGYSAPTMGTMGYHEDIDSIRKTMMTATPEEREKICRELRQIVSM